MGTSHTLSGKLNYRGLDLEKTSRLRSRQKFFLDFPFDRTHLNSIGGDSPIDATCWTSNGWRPIATALAASPTL